MRTLASRSLQWTQEIQQIVERPQAPFAAVVAMETGQSVAQDSVKHAGSVNESRDVILRETSNINQKNIHIAGAAEQLAGAAEEINRNIAATSHVTNEASDGTEQTTGTAKELNGLAQQLYTMVEQFDVRQGAG